MCFENDRGVMSYLFFLHSLINEAQDVKELRVAGVLYDSYFSDTELQELFREICRELPGDPDTHRGVKKQIQEYYGTLGSRSRLGSRTRLDSRSAQLHKVTARSS
ncbi:UPF0481 protein At3g47200-like [Fagus crenata]